MMTSYKMLKMNGASNLGEPRKVVCRRCGLVIDDSEPCSPRGEFWHAKRVCSNSEKCLTLSPEHQREVSVFERKRIRRAARRAGVGL